MLPNVIFCNLQNSGSSAVDPILRDIYRGSGYHITPYGPENTAQLFVDIANNKITYPFYHWTHNSVSMFTGMLRSEECRFIYMHRDPRDAAVSWAHDFQRSGICGDMNYYQILEMVVTRNQPMHVRAAIEWCQSQAKIITFNRVKTEIQEVVYEILDFTGYTRESDECHLSRQQINAIIQQNSFETVTGRMRGEKGNTVRTNYLYRKGISGEWMKEFSSDLILKCHNLIGQEIIKLGYDVVGGINAVSKPCLVQLVSPPFACGVAWLVNALLYLDIRLTNVGFEPGHWKPEGEEWSISEKAESHLRWHLPVLHQRQRYKFPEAINIRWEHRMDFASEEPRQTILYIRDPRDAVYSMYRRNYSESITFTKFLCRPDEWPDHFAGLFQLPPLETFSYYCWFWLEMGKIMPVKIVKYEDCKEDGQALIHSLLEWLGISRDPTQVAEALTSSGFHNAKKAMQQMEIQTGKSFNTARKGAVGEWKSSYNSDELKLIGSIPIHFISEMGYESYTKPVKNRSCQNIREVIKQQFHGASNILVNKWISMTVGGDPPSARLVAEQINKLKLNEHQILRICTVLQAIYYTSSIFNDTRKEQAALALKLFLNLNLFFFEDRSVQCAARYCWERIENNSGLSLYVKKPTSKTVLANIRKTLKLIKRKFT